jgi:integrase
MKNYVTTRKYVVKFLKQKHSSDIYLSKLNYEFITDFERFIKKYPLNTKQKCTQNGTMKHIERLRKVVTLALKMEWLDKDPFQKYSSRFIKKDRDFLTSFELDAIEIKNFTIPRLQLVKDLFIFSCYAGLAYVDVMRLSPKDIKRGIDGEYWLYSIRKKNKNKTEVEVKIPLLPKALEIVEKYKNIPADGGKLFPRLSDQKLNSYLKEIADVCGIDKHLTFYVARHTFATTVTLTNGVPIETVSKLLGHSSIRTTQIYAKVIEEKVSNDMQVLKLKLNDKQNSKYDGEQAFGT